MKELTSEGVGTSVKQADVLTLNDERRLWEGGVFGMHNAEQMSHTVFYYCGKFFGLRLSEQEHLTYKQVIQGCDGEGRRYIEYNGGQDKTHQGGLRHRKVAFKQVRHYIADSDAYFPPASDQTQASQDIVCSVADVLTVYLSLISEFAKDSTDGDTRFYHRPLANGKDGIPRFSRQVVGRHTLQTYVKLIAKKGGLQGNFTSHSLKASLATQLYSERVDEQLIQERTGHRSVEALRKYKRTSAELQVGVSELLQGGAEAPATKRPSHGGKENLQSVLENAQPGAFNNCTFNFNF